MDQAAIIRELEEQRNMMSARAAQFAGIAASLGAEVEALKAKVKKAEADVDQDMAGIVSAYEKKVAELRERITETEVDLANEEFVRGGGEMHDWENGAPRETNAAVEGAAFKAA
jgi:predicted  nucleic acid-binding Zn-ribbon protein